MHSHEGTTLFQSIVSALPSTILPESFKGKLSMSRSMMASLSTLACSSAIHSAVWATRTAKSLISMPLSRPRLTFTSHTPSKPSTVCPRFSSASTSFSKRRRHR